MSKHPILVKWSNDHSTSLIAGITAKPTLITDTRFMHICGVSINIVTEDNMPLEYLSLADSGIKSIDNNMSKEDIRNAFIAELDKALDYVFDDNIDTIQQYVFECNNC